MSYFLVNKIEFLTLKYDPNITEMSSVVPMTRDNRIYSLNDILRNFGDPQFYYTIAEVKTMLTEYNFGADVTRLNAIGTIFEMLKYLFELGATEYRPVFNNLADDSQICAWVINKFKITNERVKRVARESHIPFYQMAGAWRLIPGLENCLNLEDAADVETCRQIREYLPANMVQGVKYIITGYISAAPPSFSADEYAVFNAQLSILSGKYVDDDDDYADGRSDDGCTRDDDDDDDDDDDTNEYHSASARHYRECY